jgi:hypothetical protein
MRYSQCNSEHLSDAVFYAEYGSKIKLNVSVRAGPNTGLSEKHSIEAIASRSYAGVSVPPAAAPFLPPRRIVR